MESWRSNKIKNSYRSFLFYRGNINMYLNENHRYDWVTTYPFGLIHQTIFENYNIDNLKRLITVIKQLLIKELDKVINGEDSATNLISLIYQFVSIFYLYGGISINLTHLLRLMV